MTTQQYDQRLIDLETRIAFQEDSIQALSDEIYRQQKELDRLQQLCSIMLQRLQDVSAGGPGGPVDEKPPHY
jgi:SlyX protein